MKLKDNAGNAYQELNVYILKRFGFTPFNAGQPQRGIELQEK